MLRIRYPEPQMRHFWDTLLPRKVLSKTPVAEVVQFIHVQHATSFPVDYFEHLLLQHWTLVFCTSIHSFFQGFFESLSEQYPVARSSTG